MVEYYTPLVAANLREAQGAGSAVEPNELHTVTVKQEAFVIPRRYSVKKLVGKGSYGLVCAGVDTETSETVAIKKNVRVFDTVDASGEPISNALLTQKRILRELKVLMHLRNHENIVSLKDVSFPENYESFRDVYLVTDLMEGDLRSVIRSKQFLSERHVMYIIYQILCALAFTHSQNILHRDLKPENVLINSSCKVKLCDFGLARGVDFANDPTMSTNYVQTRWYRAPELLLNSPEVSAQTDVWSIGCIFAELLGGATMFRGTSPIDQIIRILNIMGTPDASDIKGSQQGIDFMKRLKIYHTVDLAMKFPHASDNAIDLLKQMLAFNHEKRISAKEALKHPYFAEIYDPSHYVEGPKFDFSFESRITDTASIKRECYNTILEFRANLHPSCEHLEPLEPVAGEDWSVMSTLTKCWAGVLSYIK